MSTTSTLPASGFSADRFEAFLETRREPGWLLDARRTAWQRFQAMSWPDRSEEEWLRTDIRLFKLDQYALPLEPSSADLCPQPYLNREGALGGATRSLNGHGLGSHLSNRWQSRGVIFGELDDLIGNHGELLQSYLQQRILDAGVDRFAALQDACWSGGHVLYVPRGVVVDEPLLMLAGMTAGGVDLGRTLIVLEEGAEATVMCESQSAGPQDTGFHCGATEIILKPGAKLRYVHLQDWGQGVWHFAHQKAQVGRDASLQWTSAAIGSRLAKVNQQVVLAQPGAECQVNGVLFTEGRQHLSYHTLQHHQAPNCRSDFLYKAALQDKSRTVWRGLIKVDQKAQKTDGYQRNDNLLLSSSARADSIPGLEILADDVRCTHGSTTSKVDEELIFYAQCRGFTRREAVRAIVTGFFQQIFDRVTIESVRESLAQAIGRRVREYE